jgi:hypothetical protein
MLPPQIAGRIVLSSLFLTGLLAGMAVKVVAAAGSFMLTGSLNTARYGHTATLSPTAWRVTPIPKESANWNPWDG